jgi:hypothetical protein
VVVLQGKEQGRREERQAGRSDERHEAQAPMMSILHLRSLTLARSLPPSLPPLPPLPPPPPPHPLSLSASLCLSLCLSVLSLTHARARYSFPPVCALDVRMHDTQQRRTGLTCEEGGRREESTSSKAAYVPGHAFACGVCRLGPTCRVR